MKKVILALVLALGLTGCAQLQQGFNFATTGVANPITKNVLYDAENAAIVVFAGLNAYKQTCIKGAIPPSCKGVIASIQVYTRQIPAQLKVLRVFVRKNDMVNAQVAYNTLMQLVTNAKAVASVSGVNLGG